MDTNLNTGNYNIPDDDSFDIKRYLSLFLSNWYWFAIALLITFSIGYGVNRYTEEVYTVSSTLLIKDDQVGGVSSSFGSVIPGGDIFKSQQNLTNEMEILRSFRINYQVMRELSDFHVVYTAIGKRGIVESRMYNNCPFIVIYDSIDFQPKGTKVDITIKSKEKYHIEIDGNINFSDDWDFGKRFSGYGFSFILQLRNPNNFEFNDELSNKYSFYFADPAGLATQYRGNLSVETIEMGASIVTLSVSGFVPEQEAEYLNKLMETYIQYGLDNKNLTADSTIKFIDEQIKTISDSLEIAADKLERFRTKNNFIDLSREGALIQNRLERLEIEKATSDLQLKYYNYLSEYVNNNNTGDILSPSVMGITDQILISLVNELSSIQKEREKLGFNIESNQTAPGLLELQADKTRKALKENIRNGMESIKISITESDKKIKTAEKELSGLPSTEKHLLTIQRKFDLNNTVYTYLLEKRAESGIARASNVSDNRVIDKASQFRAQKVKPKPRNNYMTALMLGLMIPVMLIVIIDYLNDKVIDRKDKQMSR